MIRTIRTLLPVAAVVFAAPVLAQQQRSGQLLARGAAEAAEQVRADENKAFQDRRWRVRGQGEPGGEGRIAPRRGATTHPARRRVEASQRHLRRERAAHQ